MLIQIARFVAEGRFLSPLSPVMRPISKRVFSWMDAKFGQELLVWIPPGSVLQTTIPLDPLFTVEKVWLSFFDILRGGAWVYPLIGLGVGVFGTWVLTLRNAILDLGTYLATGSFWPYLEWWPIPMAFVLGWLALFIRVAPPTIVSYYWNEWERTNNVCAIWNTVMWQGGATVEGNAWSSGGDTKALIETKMYSPGERAGQEAKTWYSRWWDGYLNKWSGRGIRTLLFPVRVYRGEDERPYVADGPKTLGRVLQISAESRGTEALERAFAAADATLRLDVEKAEPKWFGEAVTVEEEHRQLQELFLRRLGEALGVPDVQAFVAGNAQGTGEFVNLLRLEDPGLWDHRTGRRREVATAMAEAPPAISFPEA